MKPLHIAVLNLTQFQFATVLPKVIICDKRHQLFQKAPASENKLLRAAGC